MLNKEEILDESLTVLLTTFPEIEDKIMKCKEMCLSDDNKTEVNVKSTFFKIFENECRNEIETLYHSSEDQSDTQVSAVLEYIINGYEKFSEEEIRLLSDNR